jgi:hypothetical protein
LTVASLELPVGLFLFFFGVIFGLYNWSIAALHDTSTPPGTVMIAALPILVGIQFVLAFISYDISNVPRRPVQLKNKLRKKYLNRL